MQKSGEENDKKVLDKFEKSAIICEVSARKSTSKRARKKVEKT